MNADINCMTAETLQLVKFFCQEDYAIPCHQQNFVFHYDKAIVEQLFFALWVSNLLFLWCFHPLCIVKIVLSELHKLAGIGICISREEDHKETNPFTVLLRSSIIDQYGPIEVFFQNADLLDLSVRLICFEKRECNFFWINAFRYLHCLVKFC